MRVAIMQPYFFPYVGYFELIAGVDRFVLLDDVQYIRRGWVNRNRIRSFQDTRGWQYLTIPVEHAPRDTPINRIRVDRADPDWPARHQRTLAHVYGRTILEHPLYAAFTRAAERRTPSLVEVLHQFLRDTCRHLGIETPFETSEQFGVTASGEDRILDLCEAVGATVYVNLPGGRTL
jgi:hypothetical protein